MSSSCPRYVSTSASVSSKFARAATFNTSSRRIFIVLPEIRFKRKILAQACRALRPLRGRTIELRTNSVVAKSINCAAMCGCASNKDFQSVLLNFHPRCKGSLVSCPIGFWSPNIRRILQNLSHPTAKGSISKLMMTMPRIVFVMALTLTLGVLSNAAQQQSVQDRITDQNLLEGLKNPSRWLTFSGDYTGQRHSPLKQLTTQNVAGLVPQWIFQTDVPGMLGGGMRNSPLVVGGFF